MAPRKPAADKGTGASSETAKSTTVTRSKVTKAAAPKAAAAKSTRAAAASKDAKETAPKTASKAAPKAAPKASTKTAATKKTAAAEKTATDKKPTAVKKSVKQSAAAKSTKNANGKRSIDEEEDDAPSASTSRPKKKARATAAKDATKKRSIADDDDEETAENDSAPTGRVGRPKKKARVAATKTAKGSIDQEEAVEENEARAAPSKARATATPEAPALTDWQKQVALKRQKKIIVNNPVPKAALDVFVFGEGSAGELGLGSKKHEGKKPIDVKRPRLNHNLDAAKVGIVDIACGGMHAIALTRDNRVLTWGVNDDKALGRDTTWSGGVRDADKEDSDSEDEDDTGVNPLESTPTQVEAGQLTSSDIICKVVASDSASFILTTDGFVFGWGTFRGADGIIGFDGSVRVQATPVLIEPLQDITDIACGSNHVVALDVHGKVWTWGSGGQYQLGRKPLTRRGGPTTALSPQPCGKFGKKHHAVSIGAGSYHSFYIDNKQRVWAWGLNNYSQTGHADDTGKDDAMVLQPKVVESLEDANVEMIVGGEHHTVARTKDGKLLTWGRVDGHQVGQPADSFNEDNAVFDENKRPRILLQPTAVPDFNAKFIAAGVDSSFAINVKGQLYSWGFSANYQTGQGTTEDIEVPTLVDNSAIRDREMVWAGAGGQFSMAAAEHDAEASPAANGN